MLMTVKVYVTLWPAAVTVVGVADLAMLSDGDWVTVTVTVFDVALTVPPEGAVPWVVAWSDDRAVVDVGLGHRIGAGEGGHLARYQGRGGAPEHVPGGPLRLWHVAVTPPAGAVGTSVTPTEVKVTLPVLMTVKV